jgi:succinate dehydrogenase/fumarate reductase flavoprotein subunit
MAAAVKQIRDKYNSLKAESATTTRRYATLKEHIAQAEIYEKHRAINHKYNALTSSKRDEYFGTHREEITAFQNAHQYFKRVLNGRKDIPISDWRKEFMKVSGEHAALMAESEKLSQELRSAEAIKRNAEKVMGGKSEARKQSYEIGM